MMNIPIVWRRSAAAVLAVVLLAAMLPYSAFASDFDFIYDMDEVYDDYTSAVGSIMEDTYTGLQWSLEEELSYEVEKIFEEFIVLKTHDERVKYFFALPEYQRVLLVQYIRYLTEIGYFDGQYYYTEETSDDFVEKSSRTLSRLVRSFFIFNYNIAKTRMSVHYYLY